MISFEELPIEAELKNMLNKFQVDFAFQPIFKVGDSEPAFYEALMRPLGESPLELIERYRNADTSNLHIIEIMTYFGATLAYLKKGFKQPFSVNSFPSECFSPEESAEYFKCFPDIAKHLIVEMLEYPEFKEREWEIKATQIKRNKGIKLAIDDFGKGINNIKLVERLRPDYVKFDRDLISNVDRIEVKQKELQHFVTIFKNMGIQMLAEGIETKEEYDYIASIGIEYAQGYYLGVPKI